MILRNSFIEECETLTEISIEAFHTDVHFGGMANDGPPDYDSLEWHIKTCQDGDLYTYLDDEGNIIGGASIFKRGEELHLDQIYIRPSLHGMGYGRRLMSLIEESFPDFEIYSLYASSWNKRTRSLYESIGYQVKEIDGECITYIKKNERKRNNANE